ncbi:MAG: FecR domain-containing protein [Parvibaculaceae bacterium]|nr:FecR domain-containing protein [Parvibaculaceae bacterium]
MAPTDKIVEEAFDWMLRLNDAEALSDTNTKDALEKAHGYWCATSPDHAAAWQEAVAVWQILPEAQEQLAVKPKRSSIALIYARLKQLQEALWQRPFATSLSAASMAAILWLLLPVLNIMFQADYINRGTSPLPITLADGSTATLAPGAAITISFEPDRRNISLLSGAAYFEVTPDADRPFSVGSDGLSATALGTAFEVVKHAGTDSVSVTHGSVSVRSHWGTSAVLQKGDWARTAHRGFERGAADPTLFAGWRDKLLYVEDRPLSEVAETLAHYHDGPVWLVGGTGKRHVTGLYRLDTPQATLEAISDTLSISLHQIGPVIVLAPY